MSKIFFIGFLSLLNIFPLLFSQGIASDSIDKMRVLMGLYRSQPEEFNKAINGIKSPQDRKQMILDYLRMAKENFPLTAGTKSEFVFVTFLQVTDRLFPLHGICEKYFYGCHGEKAILSVAGLNHLIHRLRQEQRIGDAMAIPLSEFPGAIQKMIPTKGEQHPMEKGFLVWHGTNGPGVNSVNIDKHITPVLVRTEGNRSLFVITDSVANEYGRTYQNEIERVIRNATTSIPSNHQIEIYKVKNARQKDGFSCPIFGLCDLQAQREYNLFNFIDQQRKQEVVCEGGKGIIQALPPQFMVVTQEWSRINDYKLHNPDLAEIRFGLSDFKAGLPHSVLEFFMAHTTESNPQWSTYTRQRAYEFFEMLITDVINGVHFNTPSSPTGNKLLEKFRNWLRERRN